MTSAGPNEVQVINAETLAERLSGHERVTLLDVRGPERWGEDRERIPGAVWIPPDHISRRLHDLPRGQAIVVYCS